MAVDPGISLDVVGGNTGMMQPSGGLQPANPLAMAQSVANTQQAVVAARIAQVKFAAQQRAGEILASAPDMQTGLASLQKDPLTAAFAPEIAQSAAGTYGSILESQGKIQSQGRDAFEDFMKKFPVLIKNRDQWDAAVKTSLQLASPAVRGNLAKSFDMMRDAIDLENPDGSAPTPEQKTQRLTGWAIANGAAPAVQAIVGPNAQVNLGNRVVLGRAAGLQGGPNGEAPGSFLSGNALVPGTAPGYQDQNALRVGPIGPGTGGGPPGGSQAKAVQPAKPVAVAGPAGPQAPSPGQGQIAADGKPLLLAPDQMLAPQTSGPKNLAGNPTGLAGSQAAQLMKDFSTEGTHIYSNAVLTRAQLQEMGNDIDTMAKGGGFLVPGTAADFRVGLGKFAKMIGDVTGTDLGVDANKIASAEDMMKATQRMGITYLNTALGSQREAAETIKNITEKGVPGINNTYMGSKMLVSMIGALNDRVIDQYNWQTKWANDPRNNGNLTGALQKFNESHPADGYIDAALARLGMNRDGFTSPAAVQKALDEGLITVDQANAIRKARGKIPSDMPKGQ